MKNNKYPALLQFFSCYFHQDWLDEFDSPELAVDSFIESESSESVEAASDELTVILDAGYGDDEMLRLLSELGCYYELKADYSSPSLWLKDIHHKLNS